MGDILENLKIIKKKEEEYLNLMMAKKSMTDIGKMIKKTLQIPIPITITKTYTIYIIYGLIVQEKELDLKKEFLIRKQISMLLKIITLIRAIIRKIYLIFFIRYSKSFLK